MIQSGLWNGRAGLILYLHTISAGQDESLPSHLESLAWHAVSFRSHLAFVGDQLMRLSMDLATGSAGVLLALGGVLSGRRLSLPFLRSSSWMTGTDAIRARHPLHRGIPTQGRR